MAFSGNGLPVLNQNQLLDEALKQGFKPPGSLGVTCSNCIHTNTSFGFRYASSACKLCPRAFCLDCDPEAASLEDRRVVCVACQRQLVRTATKAPEGVRLLPQTVPAKCIVCPCHPVCMDCVRF